MAADIQFDPAAREIIITNGDFTIVPNASIQKAEIIQYSSGAFVMTPTLGVGLNNIINSSVDILAKEMNRWREQCIADGAQKANWGYEIIDKVENVVQINTEIYYE